MLKWLDRIGVAAVSGVMLYVLLHYSDYVYKFARLSYFSAEPSYLLQCLKEPAGLLSWAGRLLTQYCHQPPVGALLLVLILASSTVIIYKGRRQSDGLSPLGILPSLFIFLYISRLGYVVFTSRSDALIFTQTTGLLCSSLLLLMMTGSRHPIAAAVIATIAAYPLIGFYALLPALTYSFRKPLATVPVLAAPALWYFHYECCSLPLMWLQGTPCLDFADFPASAIPLYAAWASFCLIGSMPKVKMSPVLKIICSLTVYSACICSLYILPERHALFHDQMKAERAMDSGSWAGVLTACTCRGATNDILIAYRNAALYRQGRLSRDCLNYSFDTVPVEVEGKQISSSRIAGPRIFFNSGLLNYSSRWCMNLNVYSKPSSERYQFLAKAALYSGDYALALKYIDALSHSRFYRTWADKYRAYALNPELLEKEEEFRLLRPLAEYKEKSWMSSDEATTSVLYFYAKSSPVSKEQEEWYRAAKMMTNY